MEEMLEELTTLILLQGDYVWLTSGRIGAERFIGFEIPEENDCLSSMPPYKVDLFRFALIKDLFEEAYNFAFRPSENTGLEDGVLPLLRTFISNMPRTRIHPLTEEQPLTMGRLNVLCKSTVDTACARWKFEVDQKGHFSIRELSLLSRVADHEIRSAVEKGHLDTLINSKPLLVSFEEARRWLFRQHGFQPKCARLEDNAEVKSRLALVQSAGELGTFIRQHRCTFEYFIAPKMTEYSPVDLEVWESGGFGADQKRAADLARRLHLDIPLFVGKVVEVSMRQRQVKR